jgi:hypothetical protein
MIKDVTYFSQAGRIQDYIDLMNHYLKASPENIKSIVEMTTSIKEDDRGNIVYKDGKPVLVGEFSKYADTETLEGSEDPTPKIVYQNSETNTKEMTEHLDERRKKLVSLAEKVEQVREEIDVKSGGKFSADDLMFMTSLRMTALNH